MKLVQLTPNLMVADVNKSMEFYCEVLGFSVRMAVDYKKAAYVDEIPPNREYIYAQLEQGGVEIMVQKKESMQEDVPVLTSQPIGASVSLYIIMEGIEKLYHQVKEKCDCIKDLQTTWYSMKEFYIRDIDGYILCFAEQEK